MACRGSSLHQLYVSQAPYLCTSAQPSIHLFYIVCFMLLFFVGYILEINYFDEVLKAVPVLTILLSGLERYFRVLPNWVQNSASHMVVRACHVWWYLNLEPGKPWALLDMDQNKTKTVFSECRLFYFFLFYSDTL